jgi:hypothetical protein
MADDTQLSAAKAVIFADRILKEIDALRSEVAAFRQSAESLRAKPQPKE